MATKPKHGRTIAEAIEANQRIATCNTCGAKRHRLSVYCGRCRRKAERWGVPGGQWHAREIAPFIEQSGLFIAKYRTHEGLLKTARWLETELENASNTIKRNRLLPDDEVKPQNRVTFALARMHDAGVGGARLLQHLLGAIFYWKLQQKHMAREQLEEPAMATALGLVAFRSAPKTRGPNRSQGITAVYPEAKQNSHSRRVYTGARHLGRFLLRHLSPILVKAAVAHERDVRTIEMLEDAADVPFLNTNPQPSQPKTSA